MQDLPNLRPLCSDPFSPADLLDALRGHGELARLMAASAEVWEGYTVEQHTEMVMNVFEKFWGRFFDQEGKIFWRLLLLTHDIGKPVAVEKYGTKDRQHETTWPIMKEVMAAAQCSELELKRAKVLLQQDVLGEYFKDKIDRDNAVQQVLDIQKQGQWTIEEALFRLKVFFCSDAGGYTTFAGGIYSLDYLFEVDEDQKVMEFSNTHNDRPEYQQFTTFGKFQLLAAAASASSAASMAGKLR